jgi:hypothetical protein
MLRSEVQSLRLHLRWQDVPLMAAVSAIGATGCLKKVMEGFREYPTEHGIPATSICLMRRATPRTIIDGSRSNVVITIIKYHHARTHCFKTTKTENFISPELGNHPRRSSLA